MIYTQYEHYGQWLWKVMFFDVVMTQGQKKSFFTKRQTIRLIELYGDLNKIYENLTKILSTEITQKLISNKDKLLAIYQSSKFSKSSKIQTLRQQGGILDLATVCNEEILRDYGFYSLVRMLKSPTSINLKITKNKVDLNNYEAVIDRKQLNILVSLVIDADSCKKYGRARSIILSGRVYFSATLVLLVIVIILKILNTGYFVDFEILSYDLYSLGSMTVESEIRQN